MIARLISNWVYGGALAGVLLLLLTPVWARYLSLPVLAVYLHLPAYMLHQLEEHDRDRFRISFNEVLGKGHEVLTPQAVFITNVPGVWLVISLSLYLSDHFALGWGLIAVYLVLVNSLAHLGQAVRLRSYNPGLGSAVLLFGPLGGVTWWLIVGTGSATPVHHAVGLTFALVIHGAILVHVRGRLRRLQN